MNRTEVKSYQDLAQDMADQFRNGENVHAGNLAYLQGFSQASQVSYDWLMDEIAEMYDVVQPMQAIKLGGFAVRHA